MELDEAGLCLVDDPAHRALYMFNHIEYDTSRWRTSIGATQRRQARSRCR